MSKNNEILILLRGNSTEGSTDIISYLNLFTFGWRKRKVLCQGKQEDEIVFHLFVIPQDKEFGEFSQFQVLYSYLFAGLGLLNHSLIYQALKYYFPG